MLTEKFLEDSFSERLAKALCNGGLPCAEVTFRTDAAEESIRIMSEKYPEMLPYLRKKEALESYLAEVKQYMDAEK